MSGLPMGIPAEQLTSPNLWRGMVFAEGARPAPSLWKAWDALRLTAPGTKIIGWWDDKPLATVSMPDVRASVYVVGGGGGESASYVLAIASWHAQNATVAVVLDKSIGADAKVSAINITGFHPAAADVDLSKLTIAPGKGFLLSITHEEKITP